MHYNNSRIVAFGNKITTVFKMSWRFYFILDSVKSFMKIYEGSK